jgi:hypothetical protein
MSLHYNNSMEKTKERIVIMDGKCRKEVKRASKRQVTKSTLLLGRRVDQGINISVNESVDRAESIGNILNTSVEIINAGFEGTMKLMFAGNEIKLPVRRRPVGEDEEGQINYQYYSFFEQGGMKMEIDLSLLKTNIGVKSDKEKLEVTRTEVYYKRKVDPERAENKIPAELSLKEIYKESDDFDKIALLSKRRVFLQNLINKLEEIIKTNNAIKYSAHSLKRTPEQIFNVEQLSALKNQRDGCIVNIREIEAEIQKESSDTQKFMHAALQVLSPEQIEEINKKIK